MNIATTGPLSLLLLSLLFLSSCGSTKTITRDTMTDVLAKVGANYQSIPHLSMKGTMKFSQFPVTIWFDGYVKEHDSLKIVMTGPFGIAVGALAATPERFTFLNLQESVVVEGRPDRATLEEASGMQLDYQEMVALMRAEVPRLPSAADLQSGAITSQQDGDKITYTLQKGDITETFTVDPDRLVVTKYIRTQGEGTSRRPVIEVTYDKFFHKVNDRVFPEETTFRMNDGESSLKVTFEKIKGEIPDDVSLAISIPAGMERREM